MREKVISDRFFFVLGIVGIVHVGFFVWMTYEDLKMRVYECDARGGVLIAKDAKTLGDVLSLDHQVCIDQKTRSPL
jgi:hypothetical protein